MNYSKVGDTNVGVIDLTPLRIRNLRNIKQNMLDAYVELKLNAGTTTVAELADHIVEMIKQERKNGDKQ